MQQNPLVIAVKIECLIKSLRPMQSERPVETMGKEIKKKEVYREIEREEKRKQFLLLLSKVFGLWLLPCILTKFRMMCERLDNHEEAIEATEATTYRK